MPWETGANLSLSPTAHGRLPSTTGDHQLNLIYRRLFIVQISGRALYVGPVPFQCEWLGTSHTASLQMPFLPAAAQGTPQSAQSPSPAQGAPSTAIGKGQIFVPNCGVGFFCCALAQLQPAEKESAGPDLCLCAGVTAGRIRTDLWSKPHRMMFLSTPCSPSPPCTLYSRPVLALCIRMGPRWQTPALCPGP